MDRSRLSPYKEKKKKKESNKHEVSVHGSGYDRDWSDPKCTKQRTQCFTASEMVKLRASGEKESQLWLNWCCKSVDGYARIHNNLTEVTGQGKIQTLIVRKRSVNKCKNSRFPCTTHTVPGPRRLYCPEHTSRAPLKDEGPVSTASTMTQ